MNFLDDFQRLAFGIAAHSITEQFIYANMLPHVKKSINQVHLKKDPYEQVIRNLERELQLNGFEPRDEPEIYTMSLYAAKPNSEKPKLTCHHCRKTKTLQESMPSAETTKRTNWGHKRRYWKLQQWGH